MRRLVAFVIAALGAPAVVYAPPAAAQSCYGMQAELMQLQSEGQGGFGERARYERAFREQANVLARTEMRARNAGCFGSGFFLFRRQRDASCNSLIPKLNEMQENLARLDQLRRHGGSDNSYRIRELQGMMSARGCDIPGGSVFETFPEDNWPFDSADPYSIGGTYRTLCVRTCDGYYFPISFSTTSEQFPEDARACQAMCPGTQAMLFYHPNPGGGPEEMVSMEGVNYSALPTAFKYRTSLDSTCTCKPAGGYSVAMTEAPEQAVPLDPTAPVPRPRPAPGEDPETLADRAGSFVPRVGADDTAGGIPVATSADGRAIRVVGPALGNAAQDALVIAPVPN